jgi:hypothetical protein
MSFHLTELLCATCCHISSQTLSCWEELAPKHNERSQRWKCVDVQRPENEISEGIFFLFEVWLLC